MMNEPPNCPHNLVKRCATCEAYERKLSAPLPQCEVCGASRGITDGGRIAWLEAESDGVHEQCDKMHARAQTAERGLRAAEARIAELTVQERNAGMLAVAHLKRGIAAEQKLADANALIADQAAQIVADRMSLVEVREIAVRNANDCQHLRQSAVSLTQDLDALRAHLANQPAAPTRTDDSFCIHHGTHHCPHHAAPARTEAAPTLAAVDIDAQLGLASGDASASHTGTGNVRLKEDTAAAFIRGWAVGVHQLTGLWPTPEQLPTNIWIEITPTGRKYIR